MHGFRLSLKIPRKTIFGFDVINIEEVNFALHLRSVYFVPMSNSSPINFQKSGSSDLLGAVASVLCLIHCVATPFLFIAHSAVHGHHDHHEHSPVWWSAIDFIFLVISFIAIRHSAKHTTAKWMPMAMYISWGLLAAYILVETFHLFHLSHSLIYIPALSLVVLHLYNRRYCNC